MQKCYKLSQLLAEKVLWKFQKCQKHIEKDIGFSLCTALPHYHMSSYLRKCTEVESTRKVLGMEGAKSEIGRQRYEVQGCGRVRFEPEVMRGMPESHGQAGEAR